MNQNLKINSIENAKNQNAIKSSKAIKANIANILEANKKCINYTNEKKYFHAPFESLKEYTGHESSLVQLNTAIILQSIIDCSAVGVSKHTIKIREESRNWIFSNCKSFQETCINANLHPAFIINITKQTMGIKNECDDFVKLFSKKNKNKKNT